MNAVIVPPLARGLWPIVWAPRLGRCYLIVTGTNITAVGARALPQGSQSGCLCLQPSLEGVPSQLSYQKTLSFIELSKTRELGIFETSGSPTWVFFCLFVFGKYPPLIFSDEIFHQTPTL